jgi:hypothetical protein
VMVQGRTSGRVLSQFSRSRGHLDNVMASRAQMESIRFDLAFLSRPTSLTDNTTPSLLPKKLTVLCACFSVELASQNLNQSGVHTGPALFRSLLFHRWHISLDRNTMRRGAG